MSNPKLILLFSGKRKSGKDYISEKLCEKLTRENCVIVRISEPIKSHYAKVNNLDLAQLLSDGAYKENYRLDMIKWSEEVRSKDHGIFCRIACENASSKSIWIVSDIRRKTDLIWFEETYKNIIKTVRVIADIETRKQRGLVFTMGVDDAESECDLDDVQSWDYTFQNNNSAEAATIIENLYLFARNYLQ